MADLEILPFAAVLPRRQPILQCLRAVAWMLLKTDQQVQVALLREDGWVVSLAHNTPWL